MSWTRTSNIDTSSVSGSIPCDIVRLPCGSMSMHNTRCPSSANAAARFKVVVVLATPPFWLAKAMTLALPVTSCSDHGCGNPSRGPFRPLCPVLLLLLARRGRPAGSSTTSRGSGMTSPREPGWSWHQARERGEVEHRPERVADLPGDVDLAGLHVADRYEAVVDALALREIPLRPGVGRRVRRAGRRARVARSAPPDAARRRASAEMAFCARLSSATRAATRRASGAPRRAAGPPPAAVGRAARRSPAAGAGRISWSCARAASADRRSLRASIAGDDDRRRDTQDHGERGAADQQLAHGRRPGPRRRAAASRSSARHRRSPEAMRAFDQRRTSGGKSTAWLDRPAAQRSLAVAARRGRMLAA